jgi:hypothetical protein
VCKLLPQILRIFFWSFINIEVKLGHTTSYKHVSTAPVEFFYTNMYQV